MTLRRYDSGVGSFEQAEYRGQMPAFFYEASSGRWVDAYLRDGLAGYWSGESATILGSTVRDASGNRNDGERNSGVGVGVEGVVGEGFDFNGSDGYIGYGNILFNNWSSLTVAAWIYPNSLVTNSTPSGHGDNEDYIIHKAGNSNDPFGLSVASGGTGLYLDNGTDNRLQGSAPQTGTATHILARYDGAQMDLFIDGDLDASQSASGDVVGTTNELRVGGNHEALSGNYFDGIIDEIRVYNRALSGAEIQALYGQGAPL